MPSDQVNIKIGFTVDKAGLQDLQSSLTQITKTSALAELSDKTGKVSESMLRAGESAQQLKSIVASSWNSQLNQLDLTRFNQQLDQSGINLTQFKQDCYSLGAQGVTAFNKMAMQIGGTTTQLRQSNKMLDQMADTLGKTVRWTMASSAIRKVTSSIREAWNFTKDLDESLNDIRIVTGKSADKMAEFAEQANNAAKALGATTTDYTNASLIFYQQGLSDEEVQARAEVVTKVANVTGQAASEVADNLTAVWNGYQVTAEAAESSIDILAAVAANTASNLEELSTGMTKVAAAANEMGVGEAQLASQISTIVSTTRQAPETVGQALKTIYARMSTISAGGEDEDDGATLTSYTAKMDKFGISVLDANGHLRDMGDVIEEIGEKWDTFSRESQVTLAQTIAGTRQYVNAMALFENWDQYTETLEIAENSQGTLQEQQDIYMESTEAHLQQMTATAESLYMTLFDTSAMNKMIDALTEVINIFDKFSKSLGGGMQSLVNYALILANLFSTQIAKGIAKSASGATLLGGQTKAIDKQLDRTIQLYQDSAKQARTGTAQERMEATATTKGLESMATTQGQIKGVLHGGAISQEDYDLLMQYSNQIAALKTDISLLEQQSEMNRQKQYQSNTEAETSYAEQLDEEKRLLDVRQKGADLSRFEIELTAGYAEAIKNRTAEDQAELEIIDERVNAANEEVQAAEAASSTIVTSENGEKQILITMTDRLAKAQANLQVAQEEQAAKQAQLEADKTLKLENDDLVKMRQLLVALTKDDKNLTKEQTAELNEALKILEKTNLTQEEFARLSKIITHANKESVDLTKVHRDNITELNAALNNTNALNNRQLEADKADLALKEGQYDALMKQKTLTKELSAAFSGMTGLMVAIPQLQNIGNTLTDQSLSAWDKFGQLSMSISFTIPMLTRGFKGMSSTFQTLAKGIQANKALPGLKADLDATTKSIENTTKGLQGYIKAENAYGQKGYVKREGKSTYTWIDEATYKQQQQQELEKLTAQQKKQQTDLVATEAQKITGFGNMSLAASLGVFAGIAVAAAVAAVAIYQGVRAYNEWSRAAENAALAAENLQDAADNAASACDSLQSSIDSYEDAIDTLNECTQGTEEWTDALKDANSAAQDLLSTLADVSLSGDEIRGLYSRENGLIVIDEDALSDIMTKQEAQVQAATMAAASGSNYATQIQIQSDLVDAARRAIRQDYVGGMGVGYNPQTRQYDYTVTGKMLGEMIDTNIEAFIGFDGTVWDAADMLKELIPACGSLSDDALVDLAEEVLDLANTMDAATATLKANMDYIITAMYGDTVSDYEAELASREATAFQQSLEDAWNNYLAGNPLSDVEKQLLQESGVSADVLDKTINRRTRKNSDQYTEILGLLQDAGYNYSRAGNAVRKTGEDRIFVFTDRDTHEEVEMYSEEIAATLAATAAVEALDDTIENASDIIKTINNNFGGEDDTNGLNTLIEDYITNGNLNNASNTQINALQDLLLGENNEGIEGIGSALADYLTTIGLSEEDIAKIFDFEDFENQMANYLEGYKAAFQEISDAALTSFAEGMEDLSLEQVGAVNNMINDLQSAYEGTDAFDDIVDVLNEVGESDEVSGFVDALDSLEDSWGTVSMSEFTNALEDNGVELEDITNDQLATFVGALNNMAKEMEEATGSLEEMTKSINDLVDGLEYGSTLSEDDYNDLIALDNGMSQFFSLTTDGMYKLIASAQEFNDYVDQYELSLFDNDIAQIQEQRDTLESVFGENGLYNYNNEDTRNVLTSVANAYEEAHDEIIQTLLGDVDTSNTVAQLYQAEENLAQAQQDYNEVQQDYNEAQSAFNEASTQYAEDLETYDALHIPQDTQDSLDEANIALGVEKDLLDIAALKVEEAQAEYDELLEKYNGNPEAYNTFFEYMVKQAEQANGDLKNFLSADETQQQMQLGFLELYQDATGNVIDNLEELANDPEALAKAVQDAYEDINENYDEYMKAFDEQESARRDQLAASAESLDELNQLYQSGRIYADEYNKYFQELYNQERYADLDTEEIQNYAKYLQEVAAECDDLANSLANDSDAAYGVAAAIMRMNNGVETLQDNYEDWIDILEKSSKSSYEYAEALMGVTSSLSDILDVSEDFIDTKIVTENLDDIALAAEGDEDAIDRLRAAALEGIVLKINETNETQLEFNKLYDDATYTLDQIQKYFDENMLEVGATISNINGSDDFINSLNAIIDATQMTEDQVTAMLAGMGYDVEFEEGSEEVVSSYPVTVTHNAIQDAKYNINGDEVSGYDVTSWSEVVDSTPSIVEQGTIAENITTGSGKSYGGNVSVKGHVSKVTKKPTGSFNNYSSKNAGGNTSEDSGSGSEPSHEDYLEDEIDRYHDIDLQLKKISTSLDRVQKQESKLFGQAYLDNLNEQLALLNEQISATTTKLDIANDELLEYRTKLAAQGVTFDAEGYISNYTAILSSQLNAVNAMINTYNNMSADEQEAYQDTLDAAKDAYDQLVEDISHYDELLSDTIPGLVDDIADALDQQIEIQITKFTMEVEIRLDMTEAEKDWNTFYRKIILGIDDDDLYGSALENYLNYQSLYNTNNSGVGSIQALTEQVRATYEQLQQYDETGWMSVYGDNYSQALEDLKNYNDQLQDAIIEAKDDIDALWDTYLSEIDAVADVFEDHLDQYEQLADQLDHDLSLIQLLYGDEAYGQMETYYRQIYNNNVNQLSILKDQADFYKNMMDAATDDEEYKKWRDLWEDAIDEVNDMLEDALESAMDLFENTINQMIDEFNKVATNGLGLSFLGDQWDLINDEADIYLDKVNAIYSVQELQNKYLEAIDATDSISAQQKLNALMEEQIGYLTEKENLTQYDIDRAELEYEIMLKQIALEEAQQNKSSMRLRRDAQGNYTYQYVSDEDEIRGLEQELADLQNQLYNLDLDAYKENLNNVYDAYKDLMEELANLDALYRAGDIEDEETYQAERAEIIKRYEDIIADYVTETDVARRNLEESFFNELAALYAEDPEVFKAMLDEETLALLDFGDSTGKTRQELYEDAVRAMQNLSDEERELILNEMIPYANSGIAEMAESLEEFLETEGNSIEDFFADLMDELAEAETEYEENVDRVLEVSNTAVDELIEGNDSVIDSLNDVIAKTQEQIDIEEEQLQEIKELWDATEDMRQEYALCTDSAVYWAQAAYDYWMAANQMAAEASDSALDAASSYAYATSEVLAYADAVQAAAAAASAAGIGSSSSSSSSSGTIYHKDSGYYTGSTTSTNSRWSSGDYSTINDGISPLIQAYASGGYTGDWHASNGALAVLHQKELVLNEDDTKNFLQAVEAIRDIKKTKKNSICPPITTQPITASPLNNSISNAMDTIANTLQNKMTTMESALNGMFKENEILDQNVHIEAHFPNVTNSTEIENAFNNLVNVASQYANRTNARR